MIVSRLNRSRLISSRLISSRQQAAPVCAQPCVPSGLSSAGFTLIEVLVALFIFSWIGLGSYQILDQVIRAQKQQQLHSEQLARKQKLSWQLRSDFKHMVARKIKDEEGFVRDVFILDDEDYIVEFTRTGWANPLGWPRSELQRVAYSIDYHPEENDQDSPHYKDETLYLIRHYWPVLDRAVKMEPIRQVLVGGVEDMEMRFYQKAAAVSTKPKGFAALRQEALESLGLKEKDADTTRVSSNSEWLPEPPPAAIAAPTHPMALYATPEKIEITLHFDDESMLTQIYNVK